MTMQKIDLKTLFKLLLITSFVMFLSGCLTITSDLNYQPSQNMAVKSTKSKAVIEIAPARDLRGLQPNLIATVLTSNYTPTGMKINSYKEYNAESPVTSTVNQALHHALTVAGYQINKNHTNSIITANLLKVTMTTDNGIYYTEMKSKIIMQFVLVDSHTSQVLWKKTFVGEGAKSGFNIINYKDTPVVLFNQALTSIVEQLINSNDFRRAVR